MTEPAPVLRPEDRRALRHLVLDLAERADHQRVNTLYELFTDDGVMILSPSDAERLVLEGREAIKEWGRVRVTRPGQSLHFCMNMRFVATGPDTASGTTYLMAYRTEPGGDRVADRPSVVGEYLDDYVRVDGEWRFSRRDTIRIGHPR